MVERIRIGDVYHKMSGVDLPEGGVHQATRYQ